MGQTTKSLGQKDPYDRFYTKEDIALRCIQLIDNIEKYSTIIEPSAGAGAFSLQLPKNFAFDLLPNHPSIQQLDWFDVDLTVYTHPILVIGNPPFGEYNQLAIKFFNYAASNADTIAFILPKSFRKSSIINRLNNQFWLVKEIELPQNSFLFEGQDYDVNCIFQVWERRLEHRPLQQKKLTSSLFTFTTADKADLSIRRVGANAGKASLRLDYAAASNYFIKNHTDLSTEEFVNLVNQIDFATANDTVKVKSLSKGDLVEALELYLIDG